MRSHIHTRMAEMLHAWVKEAAKDVLKVCQR